MEVLHPHCAGLDVHKDSVVACVRHMVDGKIATQVKTLKTTTQELTAPRQPLISLPAPRQRPIAQEPDRETE